MENKETIIDKILQFWRIYKVKKYIKPETIVCDLGCGADGVFLKKIMPVIKKGIGLDLEAREEKKDNLDFKKVDINVSLPIENDFCDYVTALAVIEHIDNFKDFSQEILRILKPSGACLLTTPAPKTKIIWERLMKWKLVKLSEDIHDHKNYFQGNELIDLFQKAGFSQVKLKKFQLGFNNLIIAKK